MVASGRTPTGRFAPGNPGGPGRPKRTQEERLAKLNEVMTPEKWGEIVHTAVRQAIDGDKDARAWLSKYAIGDKLTIEHEGQQMQSVVVYLPDNGRDTA